MDITGKTGGESRLIADWLQYYLIKFFVSFQSSWYMNKAV
jgi:hypothetical protein